jgi:chondroitin AC lyase
LKPNKTQVKVKTIATLRTLLLSSILISTAVFPQPPMAKLTSEKAGFVPGRLSASQDLEIIRKRIVDDLLAPAVDGDEIQKIITTIQADGSWPGINYKDVSRTGFEHSRHLENMFDLARAYKKAGSPYHGKEEAKKTLSSAMDFWIRNDFICENWWWNEMGTPNWFVNTMLIMDTDLTEDQKNYGAKIAYRANMQSTGFRPGGDQIVVAGMLAKQALFTRNDDTLNRVIEHMKSEVAVTTGRGLKPDMSFHHRTDNVISTLTYGSGFANSFSYWTVKTAGTKYALPEGQLKLFIDYYVDGISKSMAFAKYRDIGAMNRDMTRKGAISVAGTEIPENILMSSSYRKDELNQIIRVRKNEAKPNFTWNRYYWHSHYLTHQRPDWHSSVRMHSSRASNMEQPHNEEGIQMHHFGDGSNFIQRTGKEYFDIFPVWDWQKIPGTTIMQKPQMHHFRDVAKKGLSDFSGGASDGRYSALGFDLTSVHDPLKAKKAWFYFDNEYVCLGAGITTTSNLPVVTTLNQSLLNGNVIVKLNKQQQTLQKGKHTLTSVSWILHDSVGYLFRNPSSVQLNNTTATGSWRAINHHTWATDDPVNLDVFLAWLDHGNAKNASYEYIVVPNVSASSFDAYSKKLPVTIIANTPELQAVRNQPLGITQAVFYSPGKVALGDGITLSVENPCIVMVKMNGKKISKVSVVDPTHKLSSLKLTVNTKLEGSGENWSIAQQGNKESVINVQLPTAGYAGQTVVMEMK